MVGSNVQYLPQTRRDLNSITINNIYELQQYIHKKLVNEIVSNNGMCVVQFSTVL